MIQSEDFLHRFVITAKAATNTRRREKIRLLAQLLQSSFVDQETLSTDVYEELLSILDGMSYRELCLLKLLEQFENAHPIPEGKNALQRAFIFWGQFLVEAKRSLNVEADEISAMLTRLNRTGCYSTFIGSYTGYSGDRGHLTNMYFKLREHLEA